MKATTADRKLAIKRAIEATSDKAGRVTPDGVVAAAKDERNPLHGEFPWDNAVAAHQHRLDIARSLIREVRYVAVDTQERVVQTVSYVHDPRSKEQGYIPLRAAAKNKDLAREIMTAELNRCESAINRAMEIADVLDLEDQLEELRAVVARLKARLSKPARSTKTKSRGGRRPDSRSNGAVINA